MIKSFVGILVILTTLVSFNSNSAKPTFDIEKDLLLLNFDLKTDVDDVHTIAALDLILKSKAFKKVNYYAISGTYGMQGGSTELTSVERIKLDDVFILRDKQ